MQKMKITAGLGRLEDFSRLVSAGADELFTGFVPLDWLEKYGNDVPLNRREVLLQDIQIDTFDDMRTLAKLKADAGVSAALTFNAPCYHPSAYPVIADMLFNLQNMGFNDFIIADPGLLVYLNAQSFRANLHISGEAGAFSPDAVRFFETLGAARIIFPRKVSPERMTECTAAAPQMEYEAFILNEMCHYSGAFCSSLHCDFLDPLCRVPYICHGFISNPPERDPSAFGASGCGICALERLRNAGVSCLKIVGRGGHANLIERDIRMLKAILSADDLSPAALKKTFFPDGCAGNCYYRS